MPKLLLNMEIENWDIFNKVYILGDNTNRENAGIKKIFIGHEEDKPTKVHAVFDISHTNAMREYMDNPEAKKMAQESGIKFEKFMGFMQSEEGMAERKKVADVSKTIATAAPDKSAVMFKISVHDMTALHAFMDGSNPVSKPIWDEVMESFEIFELNKI